MPTCANLTIFSWIPSNDQTIWFYPIQNLIMCHLVNLSVNILQMYVPCHMFYTLHPKPHTLYIKPYTQTLLN